MPEMKDIATKVNTYANIMIRVMLIIVQTLIYVYTLIHSCK